MKYGHVVLLCFVSWFIGSVSGAVYWNRVKAKAAEELARIKGGPAK
jgi:hypothetical protein